MATASPLVLRCAVCCFESELIQNFENHCCSTNNNAIQLKDVVPKKFHRLISTDLLYTYVFENENEADKFRQKSNGNEDKSVMVFNKSKPLYTKIEDNLSDLGRELVRSTFPWVVNLLVDWSHFDEVICNKPSRYEVIKNTERTGESKTDVPSTSSSSAIAAWSKVATSHLIELHTMHSAKFSKPSMKKKEVWKIICSEMHNKGFLFTVNQCEQKWKNLTKAYRDCIDHNSKSGNERKECPFYKELEDCYGYKPNVKPLFTLGTHENETENTDVESKAESTSSDGDVTPKRKRRNQPTEIVEILDDMRKEHKEMMKTLKEQHEKKMENEERKLEIMAQLVEAMKKQ